jgi:hypothetical protein
MIPQKLFRQDDEIFLSFSQGGKIQPGTTETVEEILPEQALAQ